MSVPVKKSAAEKKQSAERRQAIVDAVARRLAAAPALTKKRRTVASKRGRPLGAKAAKAAALPVRTTGELSDKGFWAIIAATKPDRGFDFQVTRLTAMLSEMALPDVQAFEARFRAFQARLEDNDDLREVVHDLGGGAGDEGWSDFQSWLISRGGDVYRAAVRRPSSLRAVAAESDEVEFEEFQHIAGRIIKKLQGGEGA